MARWSTAVFLGAGFSVVKGRQCCPWVYIQIYFISLIYFKAAGLEESITVILQGKNILVLFCYLLAILSLGTSVFLTKHISPTLHISVAGSPLEFLSPSGYSAMKLTGFFLPLSTHIYKPTYISLPDIPTWQLLPALRQGSEVEKGRPDKAAYENRQEVEGKPALAM